MQNKTNENNLIIKGEIVGPLVYTIIYILLFLGTILEFDGSKGILKSILTGNIKFSFDMLGLSLIFVIIIMISLLFYIANKKSSLEITNGCIIINRPKNYPFFKMETINISYKDIDNVKITEPPKRSFLHGYNIIITKKANNGETENVRFFQLSDGELLISKLKEKNIQVIYGEDVPPDAGD